VAGYCLDLFSTKYSCELGWLTVDADHRKKGIGSKLLKKVEKSAKAQKLRKLFVSAEDCNSGALAFYKKNSFRTEGVLRDFYGLGEDQIILSKWLD
jgi:ribosomal protein S18 acetylase RimI-like enzyme